MQTHTDGHASYGARCPTDREKLPDAYSWSRMLDR